MARRITTVLAALALTLGLGLVAAPAAHAGNCTITKVATLCGRVFVTTDSAKGVSITNNWPASGVWYLAPGEGSQRYIRDTDGFRVPSGCLGYTGNGVYAGGTWYKIGDGATVTIQVRC